MQLLKETSLKKAGEPLRVPIVRKNTTRQWKQKHFQKILSLAVFMVRGLSQKGKLQPDGFWISVYNGNTPFLENLQGPPTLVKVIYFMTGEQLANQNKR